jgi:DNA-binding NtrC family response regulator
MPADTRILWLSPQPGPSLPDWTSSGGPLAVESACAPENALAQLAASRYDALVACFPLGGWLPEELLEEVQRRDPQLPVFVSDPAAGLADAVRLSKLGAEDCMGANFDLDALANRIGAAVEDRRSRELLSLGRAAATEPWRHLLAGASKAIQNVCHIVRLIGNRRCTVLITGETGTGKELVARALHMASSRAHLPLVAVNCSALPETLLESELFGHVKGAFTGAVQPRIGRFEQANRSTILLDEIGEMPLELQARLLRVLQEREFQRVGSSETVKVDVRVIAASNCNLERRVEEGLFREDLYYRLNVVPVHLPPLRDRAGDVPLLAHHFVEKICRSEQMPLKKITREACDRLKQHSWPGNVRQLENAIEKAVVLSGGRDTLYPSDFPLPAGLRRLEAVPLPMPAQPALPVDGLDFEETVNGFERSILEQALERTAGNKKRAADMLRLKRTTLAAKLRSLRATA